MSAEEKEASAPPADNKLQQYPSSPSMPAQNAVYNAEAYNQAYPGAGQMMPAYNQAYAQAMPVQMMPAGYNQAYGAPGQMPMMQQPMMQQPVMQQVQQPGMQMQQPMMQQMAPGQYVGQPQYVANPYATYVASPYPAQYVAVPQTVPEVPSPNMVANVGGGVSYVSRDF